MFYFIKNNDISLRPSSKDDRFKRPKPLFNNYKHLPFFTTGDIIYVSFWRGYLIYDFEGICISKKKKYLQNIDVSFVLRNIFLGVAMEMTFSLFFNRLFNLKLKFYKRKRFFYPSSKLYYLRNKVNKQSRVTGFGFGRK